MSIINYYSNNTNVRSNNETLVIRIWVNILQVRGTGRKNNNRT